MSLVGNIDKLKNQNSLSILNVPQTTNLDIEDKINGLWANYYGGTYLLSWYRTLKKYEAEYKLSSKELIHQWETGSLNKRNSDINHWITTYLQAKDFIHERESSNR